MIVLFLTVFLFNLANPSVTESFQALKPVLNPTAQEIIQSTESAVLERKNEYIPSTQPTGNPPSNTSSSKHDGENQLENEVQKVAAVNTSSGKVINQVSEKAVENSPVLEPCTADTCSAPQTNKNDEHKPLTPTPTDILPSPTPEHPPIKISVPPCPKYPATIAHADTFIPCLDVIAH